MSNGFGLDVWCVDQIRTGRYARGRQVVAQALYRRLITPRGVLREAGNGAAYGIDLPGIVGAVGYPTASRLLPDRVRAELLKDDRVADVSVAALIVTETNGLQSITLDANVALYEEGEEFSLSLSVSDTSVTLIGGLG